jgi:hypothetical protein
MAFQNFCKGFKTVAPADFEEPPSETMMMIPLASMLYPSPNGGRNDPYSM